jgi:hypothetical protein
MLRLDRGEHLFFAFKRVEYLEHAGQNRRKRGKQATKLWESAGLLLESANSNP